MWGAYMVPSLVSDMFAALCLLLIALAGSIFVDGATNNTCAPVPATQKNTTRILADLRLAMQQANISVYVIFSDDEHGSEYTQPYDKRRDWISGFRGSRGTAVVSMGLAALWTDGRYFTQAEEELDCANWLLMREGQPGVPSLIEWLVTEANKTTLVRIHFIFRRNGLISQL